MFCQNEGVSSCYLIYMKCCSFQIQMEAVILILDLKDIRKKGKTVVAVLSHFGGSTNLAFVFLI